MIYPLVDAESLRNTITPEVYMAVFDDERTGDPSVVDQSGPVKEVLDDANVLVISALPPIYATIPDGADKTIPVLLQMAIRLYLRYFTWTRRPEYTRVTGREESALLDQADAVIAKVQSALLRIVPNDSPPEPSPRNVGGLSVDGDRRMFIASPNGINNGGDF